jgi:hypothetical protein
LTSLTNKTLQHIKEFGQVSPNYDKLARWPYDNCYYVEIQFEKLSTPLVYINITIVAFNFLYSLIIFCTDVCASLIDTSLIPLNKLSSHYNVLTTFWHNILIIIGNIWLCFTCGNTSGIENTILVKEIMRVLKLTPLSFI